MFALIGGGVVTAAPMERVYRGGTTANDHAVALLVVGFIAIYTLLWWSAVGVGVSGPAAVALGVALSVGAVSIYGLFHVLDRRRDAGRLLFLARVSQPALAFSLWCGLLLILRGHVLTDADGRYSFHTLMPGRYLNGAEYRPAHIHVKVWVGGVERLTTQIYFDGDPYPESDSFVEEGLVIPLMDDGAGGLVGEFPIAIA